MPHRLQTLRWASLAITVGVGWYCFGPLGAVLFAAMWLADAEPGWAWR